MKPFLFLCRYITLLVKFNDCTQGCILKGLYLLEKKKHFDLFGLSFALKTSSVAINENISWTNIKLNFLRFSQIVLVPLFRQFYFVQSFISKRNLFDLCQTTTTTAATTTTMVTATNKLNWWLNVKSSQGEM